MLTIVGTSACSQCKMLARMAEAGDVLHEYREATEEDKEFMETYGLRSFPLALVDGKYKGGFKAGVEYVRNAV